MLDLWKVIAVHTVAITFSYFVCYLRADDALQKLPFCNPTNVKDSPVYNDLIIISTLDGRLTAFSTQTGIKAWDLETQPLLSSNLHHVELTAAGKWVRLVPSLRGTLYSLSGDTIEPLPFDAEQLLSSSFKYSDDLVIAGARETLWSGVDAHTGQVLYECGSSGCTSEQQRAGAAAGAGRDVLVLRRHSSTVRALDPRSGNEKWNFSVAEHQMAVSRRECTGGAGGGAGGAGGPAPVHVGVALHDGVVALKTPGENKLIWQQKLEAPVVDMWRLRDGALHHMDVLWEATQTLVDGGIMQQPSLYIGVHEKQLYIQESQFYARKLETAVSAKPLPWKLVTARPMISGADGGDTALTLQDTDPNALSLFTLYGNSEPTGEHGFFLYLQETCDQAVQVTEDAIDSDTNTSDDHRQHDHHSVHVHIYSLWYWWKEVLLIAMTSAFLMNLMIWPRFFAPKLTPALPMKQNFTVVKTMHLEQKPSVQEYSGRYENDFTPLRCLGRGGFGVVFEARNNIDHCSYAVKRITLPRKESKRERVLREVRALAKLEHEHIVRYFNAWVEEPPPHWQQQRDAVWMRDLDDVSVPMSGEYTATSPAPPYTPPKGDSVMLNLQKPIDDCIAHLDFEKKLASEPRRLRSRSCNDSISIVFDENASKHPQLTTTSKTTRNSTTNEDPPNVLSKHLTSDDDSYIVFANSQEHPGEHSGVAPGDVSGNSGKRSSGFEELSDAMKNSSFDKRLERVKQCENYNSSSSSKKKKKGHTRHWSLDLCVRGAAEPPAAGAAHKYLYIQMQLCRRDSLHDWLRHNRACHDRPHQAKVLFSQIVSAVEYVHLAGLIHRDLKPSNILFAPDGRVKVGDFGLVTHMSDTSQDGGGFEETDAHQRHTYRVGTHLYMSPEQLLGRPYSYKVDIYSLGLILFELLQPFGTEAERVHCLQGLKAHHYPQHFQDTYPEETEVLKLMLSEEPARRPTASGVRARAPLHHPTDPRHHFALPPTTAPHSRAEGAGGMPG